MEKKTEVLDPHDELRKLQDKVRKLEFQNEQLRSQHCKNGVIENKIFSNISNENYIVPGDTNYPLDEHDILSINSDDFLDEERWLYTPNNKCNQVSASPVNLQKWLRQDVDNNNDVEFQMIKTKLIYELDEIEQGLKRNSIDTRTFTRSKKRTGRPSLGTMVESPMFGSRRRLLSPWKTSHCQSNDDLDDFHLSMNNTLSSLVSESTLMNANFPLDDSAELTALYQKIASEPQLNISRNKTFRKTASDTNDLHATYKKLSDPEMNATFLKSSQLQRSSLHRSVDLNATFEVTPKSKAATPSALNCTFQIQDGSSNGSNRSGRAVSCDSGGDDDQHSSASDSSFSSSNRLMNVGDIQTIARLQEESLKQVMSTPKVYKRDVYHEDDLPSPILKDHNHGYQSDHSDYSSSADGRPRSSRSSLKSSPGGSPFGSTQILTNVPECIPCNPVAGLSKRDLKLIPAEKQDVPKSQLVVKPAETLPVRSRGMSGLRPPAVKTQGGNTVAPRASSQGRVSNIPRPASRIPPPRIRTTASFTQPTNKMNWMDGCY